MIQAFQDHADAHAALSSLAAMHPTPATSGSVSSDTALCGALASVINTKAAMLAAYPTASQPDKDSLIAALFHAWVD